MQYRSVGTTSHVRRRHLSYRAGLQLIRPDEFSNIIICLGSFHMAKVVLGCLGKYLKESGAENILVESCLFGVNVVDSVLEARNYSRGCSS